MSRPDGLESLALRKVKDLDTDIDLDAFSAAFDLFRLSARVIHYLETSVHRPLGLSTAGFRVLFTVWLYGSLEPRDIARMAGVSRAAVSGVVKTLERDGLAERSREQNDRRLVTVRLTPEGEERVVEAYRQQNGHEQQLFRALDRDQLRAFAMSMRTLLASPLPEDDDDDTP